ncbi:MAG TPA: tRNA glutamyl-Q(34) synthetase GluQRS [Chloroflexota bacterium]|nr:tRNA glutamyl-Q(34) synthetase GluQRS [Chloroflexota bacterium]
MPRGRFAPSPSGDLHLGGARTALAAWLAARRDGAEFLVRIEDVDRPRVVPGAEARILEDLRWLGLDWDSEPVRQSQRLTAYNQALVSLEQQRGLFPCFCSRADVAEAASAPHAPAQAYPGTCRELSASEIARREGAGRRPSLRFRAPDRELSFEDAVHGSVVGRADDFVVRRSDGLHAYQLAVVADDIASGIEEVVRGDDLLESTPRQLLLYEALGAPPPRFAHVPLLLGPDGQRLSKRHGAMGVRALRAAGWAPEQVIGWLAAGLGLCPPGERLQPAELLPGFSFGRIACEPVSIDRDSGLP